MSIFTYAGNYTLKPRNKRESEINRPNSGGKRWKIVIPLHKVSNMKLDEGFVCGRAVAWKSSKNIVLMYMYVKCTLTRREFVRPKILILLRPH